MEETDATIAMITDVIRGMDGMDQSEALRVRMRSTRYQD